MQRLQIQLLVGLGWNKASCWPLHGLGLGMGISEIILVPVPKRLCIRGRNLLHIVAKLGQLTSDIVCRHSRFDADEEGHFASRDAMRPRETLSRSTMAPRASRPIM